jgi:hypothetical protein
MSTVTRVIATLLGGILVVWLVAALIPCELFGAEVTHPCLGMSGSPADVVFAVHEGVLSLRAQDASLKGIFDAIGRQLHIEVVARIPAEEQITIAFDQLSLVEALKCFRPYVNYIAIEDATKAPGTIRKLIVVSKRAAGVESPPTMQDAEVFGPAAPQQSPGPAPAAPERPKPFRFEFDPAAVGERGR